MVTNVMNLYMQIFINKMINYKYLLINDLDKFYITSRLIMAIGWAF